MNNEYVLFSIQRILYSIGNVLKQLYPNCPIYINPNQQSTDLPCFFIQLIPNNHLVERIHRDEYRLNIDIIYLCDYNNNNQFEEFYKIIEQLDLNIDNIPYLNEDGKAYGSFGIHHRSFTTELGKISYRFETYLIVRKVDTVDMEQRNKLKKLIGTLELKGDDNERKYRIEVE